MKCKAGDGGRPVRPVELCGDDFANDLALEFNAMSGVSAENISHQQREFARLDVTVRAPLVEGGRGRARASGPDLTLQQPIQPLQATGSHRSKSSRLAVTEMVGFDRALDEVEAWYSGPSVLTAMHHFVQIRPQRCLHFMSILITLGGSNLDFRI
jgi:hypothetical protein